jgi:hypothetical protein
VTLLAAGCSSYCPEGDAVHLAFDHTVYSYSVRLAIDGRVQQPQFDCPGEGYVGGQPDSSARRWHISCDPAGIRVGPARGLEGATITLAGPGDSRLGDPIVVGPLVPLPENCQYEYQVPILFPVDPLALMPPFADFGGVVVGSTSPMDVTTTVVNRGVRPVGPIQIATTGDFSVARQECGSLPAAGRCVVHMVFHPTAIGDQQGALTVSATPGGSVTAVLTGGGLPPPDAGVDGMVQDAAKGE